MTFDQLVEDQTRRILTGFIENGGKGLKTAVYMAMVAALSWSKENERKE